MQRIDGRGKLTAKCAAHALAIIIAATLAGCGGGHSNLGRVNGVVRVNGQPLKSGKIVFQPAVGRNALGKIGPDGTFTLGTFGESDGAAIGTHQVAIVAYEGTGGGRPNPTGARKPLVPAVPERYLAAGTSGLTYEVKSGDNHPEFNLTNP